MRRITKALTILLLITTALASAASAASSSLTPSDLSAAITSVMRKYQARYHYLHDDLGIDGDEYIEWPEYTVCDGIVTPPYPSDDWYTDYIADASDPQQKAAELVNAIYKRFWGKYYEEKTYSSIYSQFIYDGFANLEDIDGSPDDVLSRSGRPEIVTQVDSYGYHVLAHGYDGFTDFPLLENITVSTSNYLDVLDALNQAIDGFNAINADLSQEKVSYASTRESENCDNLGSECKTCDQIRDEAMANWQWFPSIPDDKIGIREWTGTLIPIGWQNLLASMHVQPGYILSDLSLFNGDAKCYIHIKHPSTTDACVCTDLMTFYKYGHTATEGLVADDIWQLFDEPCTGVSYASRMLADYIPSFETPCTYPGCVATGWLLENVRIHVWPDFTEDIAGYTSEPVADEVVFKDDEDGQHVVYSANSVPDCQCNNGEIVDGYVECPWSVSQVGTDKLCASVTLEGAYDDSIAKLYIGDHRLLNNVEDTICVAKTCSGLYQQDGMYRLKLLVIGGRGGPDTIKFKVVFWRQDKPESSDVQPITYRSEDKIVTFQIKENHYSCCATEPCGDFCPLPYPWIYPDLDLMLNGDVQITMVDLNEKYIIEEPKADFIDDFNYEPFFSYGTAISIYNPDGSIHQTLSSAVVLNYRGDYKLVYAVPAGWWLEHPTNKEAATLKYITDGSNTYYEEVTEGTNYKYTTNPYDNSRTYYYCEDPFYTERITKIVHYDNYGSSYQVARTSYVYYDQNGNVTRIGESCSSCSGGGAANRILEYDEDGNVTASKTTVDGSEVTARSFEYDEDGELTNSWLGSINDNQPVQTIFRDEFKNLDKIETVNYANSDHSSFTRQLKDKAGRLLENISYESTEIDDFSAPFSKSSRQIYRYSPVSALEPSLQAYWNFDSVEGGWAFDSSVYKRHGIMSGYVENASVKENPYVTSGDDIYIDLDGENDYIRVIGYKGVLGKASRSVCFWLNTSSNGPIINWGESEVELEQDGQDWKISILNGHPVVAVTEGDTTYSCTSSSTVGNGTWHHVAVVLYNDGTPNLNEVSIYVDGSETVTTSNNCVIDTQICNDASDVKIGNDEEAYYDGFLDNIIILDRALSPREVEVLYDTQKASPVDVEMYTVIPPSGDPAGKGIRTETIYQYQTIGGNRYIESQEEIRYGKEGTQGISVSKSVYEPINSGQNTRIVESYSYGTKVTEYKYASAPTEMGVLDEIQTAVHQVSFETSSGVSSTKTMRLATHYDYDASGRVIHQYQYDYLADTDFTSNYDNGDYSGDTYLTAAHYVYDGVGNLVKQYSTDGGSPNREIQITENKYNGFKNVYMTKSPTGVVSGQIYYEDSDDDPESDTDNSNQGKIMSEFTFSNPGVFGNDSSTTDDITSYGQMRTMFANATVGYRPYVTSITYYVYEYGRLVATYRAKFDGASTNYCKPGETVTGVEWVKTEYSYDNYGRRKSVAQYADAQSQTPLTTTYFYDNQGQVEKTVSPNGKFTKTIKNGMGQVEQQITGYMESEIEKNVSITRYKYDANGNLKEQIFPDGTRTQNEYDDYGRLKRMYKGAVQENSSN